MQVKVIRKQRNFYALFFAFSSFPAVWLGVIAKTEAAITIGIVSVAFLILLIRKSRLLYDATLIWDNRILAVSSALISNRRYRAKPHRGDCGVYLRYTDWCKNLPMGS